MGRPKKYGEETTVISFKVPKSISEELKKEIEKLIVNSITVICESVEIMSIPTSAKIAQVNDKCKCKFEGKLFRRDKYCKIPKDQH